MLGRRTIRKRLNRAAHWLALAAMLVQFVASFGHIHPEAFDVLSHGHGGPMFAADHGPSRAIGDPAAADLDCPICASMQLLGSVTLLDAVRVIPPLSRHFVVASDSEPSRLTPPRYLLFDTRGPPLV